MFKPDFYRFYLTAIGVRFWIFAAVIAFVNIEPFFHSPTGCSLIRYGWPFTYYKFGGYQGIIAFDPLAIPANIVVTVVLSYAGAVVFRSGFMPTFRKWRTWGTPFDSDDSS